ncbi:hypothetical protein SAMN06265795_10785 [Noviherbaspirillum humi]|uniref:Phasin protein n=1 Tax=Noviherbaspirillum humi TaxID=1688639 RepID=A0A239HNL9_9BURK|nr:hypothetical protein [Noviherbaspirillum humi]SNS82902.1 hypothetical protein SAMN06265795_10785 [Noviherbaspirillum humi]
MANLQEMMQPLVQNQINRSRRYALAWIDGMERINRVMLEAADEALHRQLKLSTSVMTPRTASEQPGAALNAMNGAADMSTPLQYQARMVAALVDMQQAMMDTMREDLAQSTRSVQDLSAGAVGRAQEAAPATPADMFSMWTSACRNMAQGMNQAMNQGMQAMTSMDMGKAADAAFGSSMAGAAKAADKRGRNGRTH